MRTLPTRDDLRHAARALHRSPGFTAVSIVSLGLAIALAMTMFGVLDALIYPKYPFQNQRELYRVDWAHGALARGVSAQQLRDEIREALEHRVGGIVAVSSFGWGEGSGNVIRTPTTHTRLDGYPVAAPFGLFRMLGVRPLHGRLLGPQDSIASSEPAAMISGELWRRLTSPSTRFEPFRISLGDKSFTVVGVLPDRMREAFGADLWTAQRARPRGGWFVVRAQPGLSAADLKRALTGLNAILARESGVDPSGPYFDVVGVARSQLRDGGLAFGLTAAAIAVLLIACVNIANLQLARGMVRVRDLAVRAALGATRTDIVRLLVTESVMIACGGGLAAGMLSLWATGILHAVIPPSVAQLGFVDPQMSWRVFLAGMLITAVAATACGLTPAVRVSRLDLNAILKARAGTGLTRTTRQRYATLVAVEVGAALALFVGAGLVGGSARAIHTIEFGFQPGHVVAARLSTRGHDLADARRTLAGVESAIGELSGVSAVAFADEGFPGTDTLTTDDPTQPLPRLMSLPYHTAWVTSDYLRTLGIPTIAGQDFGRSDDGAIPSMIVDSVAARLYWPAVNPVGHMIKLGSISDSLPWVRVVGVARHVRYGASRGWDGDDAEAAFYLLAQTFGRRAYRVDGDLWGTLFVRGGSDPTTLARSLIDVISAHGGVILYSLEPMDEYTGHASLVESQDFIASLFVAFSGFGLLLAMIGVYGVVAHSVTQRTREFGVRIAFGARTTDILLLVLRDGNIAIFGGIALGLLGAQWGTRLLALFVVAFDGPVQMIPFVAAPFAIVLAAFAASLAPAIRAARVDPVEALRSE